MSPCFRVLYARVARVSFWTSSLMVDSAVGRKASYSWISRLERLSCFSISSFSLLHEMSRL